MDTLAKQILGLDRAARENVISAASPSRYLAVQRNPLLTAPVRTPCARGADAAGGMVPRFTCSWADMGPSVSCLLPVFLLHVPFDPSKPERFKNNGVRKQSLAAGFLIPWSAG